MFIAHSYLSQTVKDTIQVQREKPKEVSERSILEKNEQRIRQCIIGRVEIHNRNFPANQQVSM
jgi:hypothetical protein